MTYLEPSTSNVDEPFPSQDPDCDPLERQYEELRERNAVQSPIYVLPPEILSLIFQFVCPSLNLNKHYGIEQEGGKSTRRFQFNLSAVSAFWRQVVFSTPHLWTSVDISTLPISVGHASEILRVFFTGSGELPISIGLSFFHLLDVDEMASPISPNYPKSRIQELHLNQPPESLISDLTSSYTSLFRLSISSPQYKAKVLSLDVPCSHLTLQHTTMRVELHSATITNLHLRELREDVCLELLKVCVNMVEFRCRSPNSENFPIPLPTSPFTLPHLKTLEWSLCTQSIVDRAMLRNIRVPALETLVWVEEDDEDLEVTDPRITFFEHLPPTLSTLQMDGPTDGFEFSSAASDLIRRELNVDHLLMRNCHGKNINSLLHDLILNEEKPERPIGLPRLKTITIHYSANQPLISVNFDTLLQVVESRLRHRSQSFPQRSMHLNMFVDSGLVDWPIEFKEGVKDLVRRGLEVEFTEKSVPISWL